MASVVADLDAGLQAMLNLKPPGVSGSRISGLTTLCVSNIQSESVLIQKIYTHFKKTPGTHKLGVLYVVDSVTRKWLEQAKAQSQAVNSSAPDGTYAAGVHRVTELMPVLMNDILQSAPVEQKEKIKKLLDIWEKGSTFPAAMLESFRQKLAAPAPQAASTTPPGSPPPNVLGSLQSQPNAAVALPGAASGSSILEALANMARQNTTAAPSNPALPAPAASYNMTASSMPQPAAPGMPQPHSQPALSYPPQTMQQPVNAPSALPFAMPPMPNSQVPGMDPNAYGQTSPGGAALPSNTQQQLLLIKALADQGIPFDKIPALMQTLSAAGAAAPAAQPPNPYPATQHSWGAPAPVPQDPRNRDFQDDLKSPRGYGRRSRSRSPDRGWGVRGSPNTRDRQDFQRDDHRRTGDYRTRSPPGRHSDSPSHDQGNGEKWIEYDQNLPSGCIKVLSRTLFVGGVTCSEQELRTVFTRFGKVQTCIVNKEKRHAFVKMLTRDAAVNAKRMTEDTRGLDLPLRQTRWGVGFGPRDCSDYSTGISVIPIHKLTEADRKWMLTAPFGGSGGRPIEHGLVVEEPDIEIGAGVSSKAISRRMQTDKGGANGPRSSRGRDDDGPRGRRGHDEASSRNNAHAEPKAPAGAMASYPFGLQALPNGMPNFPTGFQNTNWQ